MHRVVVGSQRSIGGAAVVTVIWLASVELLTHARGVPDALRLLLSLGIPLITGILVPRRCRRYVIVLAVPLLFVTWLSFSPWNGTSDTPPGWQWTKMSLGVGVIVVGAQCLGFAVGTVVRQLATVRVDS